MQIAIPTNDHQTIAGTLAGAKGVMVYMIEEGQVRGRLFKYFSFWKILRSEGLKDRFLRRFPECLKGCDWLVVKRIHQGVRKSLESSGISIHETNQEKPEEIITEIIHLPKTNQYV